MFDLKHPSQIVTATRKLYSLSGLNNLHIMSFPHSSLSVIRSERRVLTFA